MPSARVFAILALVGSLLLTKFLYTTHNHSHGLAL